MITEFEKFIYNTFLKTARSKNKLPYKLRKNFEDFDNKNFIHIKKLSSFFKRFPHIKVEEYFIAPYTLYPDETFFPIEYYTSLKATKAYTLSQKKKINDDPDSNEQLTSIKESLVFISGFCKTKNIPISEYISHRINNEHSFIIHLKEHKVNVYTLLGFNNFEKILKTKDPEIMRFIIGEEIYNNVQNFRTRLYNSQKALKLIDLGIKKILEKS